MGFKEIINERMEEAEGENYEIVSGKGRIKMVNFIKLNGNMHCANYAFLHGVAGGKGEVRLDFARYMIAIEGVNLGRIHKALADHRLAFVRESNPDRLLPLNSVRVDRIQILHGSKKEGNGGLNSFKVADLPNRDGWANLAGRKMLQMVSFNTTGRFSRCRLSDSGEAFESALMDVRRLRGDRGVPSVGRASWNAHPGR